MPRYIDTEKLNEIVQDLNENHDAGITRYEYKLIDAVLWEFPTADVVERKVGEWVFSPDDAEGICTNCNYKIYGRPYQNTYLIVPYNFCPNCGAQMDDMKNEEVNKDKMYVNIVETWITPKSEKGGKK